MLIDAYSVDTRLVEYDRKRWQEFDNFVFNHLDIMDHCGFISMDKDIPIGFVTWDSKSSPHSVAIGHNCIISTYKGQGYGKMQMTMALEQIKRLHPETIIVSTGMTPIFLPARRMYESAGFVKQRECRQDHPIVPWTIEYCISH